MKFRKGKKFQNSQSFTGRFRAQQSGPRSRLRTATANKVAKVKRLKEIKKRGNGAKLQNRKGLSASKRLNTSNVMDARVKLLQKALVTPTKIVDARQKLTKQKDAREKIQERRFKSSHENDQNAGTSNRFNNQGGRVKLDRRGILTVKSILDERSSDVHRANPRNRQRNEVSHRQYSVPTRRNTSNTYNSNLNTFRSDRLVEEPRAPRRDVRTTRRPISNMSGLRRQADRPIRPTRINEKPYSRSMAMDYEDSMEWEENSRYSPTPVLRRNIGNSMFSRDSYHEEMLDISRGQRGLSETLRSRLDSHQSVTKRSRPNGHKIVISNLEPSVTSEDIRELFADIGDLLESRVVRPGVAEVIYERRADAIQAVDVYHNRQLDGRPMKCDMVRTAGSSANPISVSGSSRRMPSRAADMYKPSAYVTYDIDAVHTALFNK